jgi:hypothetical protein
MLTAEQVRAFALGLPSVAESPHFESASFRVPGLAGRIFATLPADGEHAHIFLEEEDSRAVAQHSDGACVELWWGKKLSGVKVSLAAATPDEVYELLTDAWRRRAPKKLLLAFEADRESN